MKQTKPTKLALLACLLGMGGVVTASAGQATYDFSTDPTSALNIYSTLDPPPYRSTEGNPGGYLAITDAIGNQSTVIIFPDIDTGKVVTSFNFSADLRIGNGTLNDGRPADGFSINYARANDPVITNAPPAGDLPDLNSFAVAGGPENGTSTGIAISFDTWAGNTLPDGADLEGIIVRVDNKTILRQPMPTRNGACADVTSIQTGPYDGLDTGDRSALCWQKIEVNLDNTGKLTVKYKGQTILDNYQTTYFPSAGQLVLAGRTGGANENTDIDNIQITTVASSDATPPSTPANLKVGTVTAGKVVLTWDASTDDSGRVAYNLQRDGTVIAQFLTEPTYTDLAVLPGTAYSYQVQAIDATGNQSAFSTAATATTVAAAPVETNGLLFETWNNITGTAVSLLTDDPRYQSGTPDLRALATAADTRTVYANDAHENYGGRLSGFLVPTNSGNYEFFIRSDDASQLYLSPDDNTNNLALIAEEVGCCAAFQETGDPRTSAPVSLVAGKRYAIQILWKEGGGGDFAQVAWRREGDTTPAAQLRPIPSQFLRTQWDPTVGQPAFTVRPQSVTLAPGGSATLSVTAIGDTPITYQWSLLGTNIAGATTASLQINNFNPTNTGVYTVTASNVFGTISAMAGVFPKGALFVEAEDFNFDNGNYIKDKPIGLNGPYPGDAYRGLGTEVDEGVDYHADGGGAQPYRADTNVDADKENQHPDGLPRGEFDVAVNNVVGWNDAGEWYNYTRQFPSPATDYNVIGRLASGGNAIHIQMDEVTGATTANQTLKKLGEFRPGRATAGWDNMEFFPLVDDTGKLATIAGWTGEKTFRVTMLPDSAEDMDYFMFVPAGGGGPSTGNNFTSVARSGNNLVIEWSSGTLESASSVNGPWTPVAGAFSPATIPISGAQQFYRLR